MTLNVMVRARYSSFYFKRPRERPRLNKLARGGNPLDGTQVRAEDHPTPREFATLLPFIDSLTTLTIALPRTALRLHVGIGN
jgi:hypothetical protein